MTTEQNEAQRTVPWHDRDYWTLARLRDAGYARPVPPPPPSKQFVTVRPGVSVKVYSTNAPREYLYFRPTRFRSFYIDLPSERLRSARKARLQLDARLSPEIDILASEQLRQLVLRARCGDKMAARLIANRAYNLLRHLELLEKVQPRLLRQVAETFDCWPASLPRTGPAPKTDDPKRERRRYPKDLEGILSRLSRLNVGAKSLAPRRPGRTADRNSFWVRLASWAIDECFQAGVLVKLFEHKANECGACPTRGSTTFGSTTVQDTYYYVKESQIAGILTITDWEKKCANLARPIRRQNFSDWRAVVRQFSRECFHSCCELREEALKNVRTGQHQISETSRLNIALNYVDQALRTLTGY
jgi:hypothetical protein